MQPMLLLFAILPVPLIENTQQADEDVWKPFRHFAGKWEGHETGQPGVGRGEREYRFVLGGKFLRIKNRSTFEPQEKNPKGDVHEDWGMLSYDRVRKDHVLREFHVEGFVNRYALQPREPAGGREFVFVTEAIENLPAGWRARLTWKIIAPNEFHERFELAAPDKDYQVLVQSQWKRVGSSKAKPRESAR